MSRIYLVDDHAMLRDGLRVLLEHAGHAVVGDAGDLPEALADIVRLQPDILLLDLQLDGRSGFELLAELGRRALPTRTIVLSMADGARNVTEALRLGASGYLLKGSASVELLAAVDAVAAGRRYLCPAVADAALQGPTEGDAGAGDLLSPREQQILVMVARGKSSSAIGEELKLSAKTVDTYRSRLMAKLRLGDVPAIVRWAIRQGLVGLDE
jgi:two-component system invasion response regulator UvrY